MEEMTIKDIAKLCGVGVSTVSRAINNHPDINPETKAMIMNAIEENGYIPNNSARNLKRTEAKSIAVLVKGMSNLFFSTMIKVMEEEIKKKKYTLVLHHVEFNEDEIDVALQLVKEKRLAGIIFLGGYFLHKEKLEKLQVPYVLSTVSGPPDNLDWKDFSSIAVDDEAESFKMVDYLIKLGHKRIAILSAISMDESIGKLRLLGYKRALQENHIPLDESLIAPMRTDMEQYSMSNGYMVTKQLLESNIKFTALYAISDMLAIGACKAILESGKRIPEDYSVAGFDGIELGKYYNPSLTTIKQPVEEMARATVKVLFKVLSDNAEHKHQVVPAELIKGESTRELL
ncbi:MAG: LacI family DNA-binding transcriptional regulator [Lachnospiraceae bacterium]|nr:LacI family DNA-binding transcriptional regulator [Lachnospiraceae bacterium]